MENKIKEKLNFKGSAFKHNENRKKYSCCIVIPFNSIDFKNKSMSIEECENNIMRWNYDEILISEEDYKELIKKSEFIKTLHNI